MEIKKGHLYLITGATGFLGTKLTQTILEQGGRVRAMSRNEGKLVELKQKFNSIEVYPGDVSDMFEVRQAIKDVTGVFHLAASKHVSLAEKFVRETVKANTIGSLNILEQTLENSCVEFVLGVSTDKAAQVAGVYGASKLLMERLFSQYEELNPNCKYRIVRYGNVLYSTGSVLCRWKDAITLGQEVVVTEPNATRFFWTIDQAITLIMDCLKNANDSKPYCPEMKSMSVRNLLQAMIEKYSNGVHVPVKVIGLQSGENLHEKVLEIGPYSNEVEQFTVEEIKHII